MKLFLSVLLIFFSFGAAAQTLNGKDLRLLPGSWKGTLTYTDYGTGKSYSMPANMDILQIEQGEKFIAAISYPDEPKANGNDTFLISRAGKVFNGADIVKLQRLKNGGIIITTEQQAQDGNDNKSAVLKHIYTIQKNRFTNRKEVKFTGEKKWLLRNEYKFYR